MKAIVLQYRDIDPGGTDNDIVLLADVIFVGAGVPGGVLSDAGPLGNGLPIPLNVTALAQYPNNIEDALIARAGQLGLPALARTDCLFPSYARGA